MGILFTFVAEMAEKTLKEKTAKGMMWGFVNNGMVQLLSALFGIYLLHRLDQADYGKVGMLLIFSSVASSLQECGFTQALCNKKEPSDADYNSVFWFNILMSAFLYVVLFFSAPLIARFFQVPELLWLSRYLFLGFFISSWGTVQRAYLFIHLMNKQSCIIAIVAMLVSGAVSVTMAALGMAYWSLATQTVLFITVVAVMNWFYSPWRPSLKIDFRPAMEMFGFSYKLLATKLFENLNTHVFGFLLGRYYGAVVTGTYTNARKWDDMSMNTINGMVQGVAQPVLTQVRDDNERYRQVFRKMLRFVCFISFPCMLGMGLIAREFLFVVAGDKWLDSALLLSMLSVHGAFFPITTLYSNLTVSQGRSNINFWCTASICVIIWIGLFALRSLGVYYMVSFFVAVNVLWLFVWQYFAWRLIGLRLWHVLMDVLPFFVFTCLVMGATWWITRPIENIYLLICAKVVLAALLYAGILWVSGAKIMRESIQYILKR